MGNHVLACGGHVQLWTHPAGQGRSRECGIPILMRLAPSVPAHFEIPCKVQRRMNFSESKVAWKLASRSVSFAQGSSTQHGQMQEKEEAREDSTSLLTQKADDDKDASMKFRRNVYDLEDWKRHRSSTRHIRHILSIASSRVIRSLGFPVLSLTLIAVIVAVYNDFVLDGAFPSSVPLLHAPSAPFQLTAPALALLLVFRTNASYARFDEAAKAWGLNVNRSRDISRQALTWIRHPDDSEKLKKLLRYCIAFPYCMKNHLTQDGGLERELTGLLERDEVAAILECSHLPNYVLQNMSELIFECKLSDMARTLLDRNLTQFHDNLGTCERIFKTPIPVSYTRLTSRFLYLWHAMLPLALWDQCNWFVVPATFFSAGALFCIEEVGVLIEEPLCMLSLDNICASIRKNVEGLLTAHDDSMKANRKLGKHDSQGWRTSSGNGVFSSQEESSSN